MKSTMDPTPSCMSHEDMKWEIFEAARVGDMEKLKNMFTEGYRISEPVLYPSLMQLAVKKGHREVVEFLIEKLYPNLDAEDMGYPLHMAVKTGNIECIETILKHVPKVLDVPDSDGVHAIATAAKKIPADSKVLNLLIDIGADVNVKNRRRMTPLHLVSWCDDLSLFPRLLEKSNEINATDDRGRTPLFLASAGGKADNVRMLLAMGADPTIPGEDCAKRKVDPLTIAAEFKHFEVLKLLAEVTPRDSKCVAIEAAATEGYAEFIKYLLEKGFIAPSHTLSLLLRGRNQDFSSTVKMLIANGAKFGDVADLNCFFSVDVFSKIHPKSLIPLLDFGLAEVLAHNSLKNVVQMREYIAEYYRNHISSRSPIDLSEKLEIYFEFFPFAKFSEKPTKTIVSDFPTLTKICRWYVRHRIVQCQGCILQGHVAALPFPNGLKKFLFPGQQEEL